MRAGRWHVAVWVPLLVGLQNCCLQLVSGVTLDAGGDAGLDAGTVADAGFDGGVDAGIEVGPCGPASNMNDATTYFLPVPGGGDAGLVVTSMASGDLDGDGMLDLVVNVSNPDFPSNMAFSNGFAVLFGEPDGGLSAPVLYDGHGYGYAPSAVALADVNGDGSLDLMIGDQAYLGSDLEPEVSVFLNDGGGGFTLLAGSFWAIPWTNIEQASFEISFIAAADMNGDGRQDLILSQPLGEAGQNIVAEILWGNADGGFDLPATIQDAAPSSLGAMAVGDFNGDGIPDLASPGPQGGIAILLGLGDGGFAVHSLPYANDQSTGVFLLRGGASPDLIVDTADRFDAGSSQVMDNSGAGSFTEGPSYLAGGWEFAIGDFNGDCLPDIVWSSRCDYQPDDGYRFAILYGSGDGGFAPPRNVALTGTCPWGIAPLGPIAHPRALAVGDQRGSGITVYGDASRP